MKSNRTGLGMAGSRNGQRLLAGILGMLAALFIAGCATTYPPAPREAATSDYNYIIGPLDTINIIVWRNPELSMAVPVRPDGKVTTPLVDDLDALGLSLIHI